MSYAREQPKPKWTEMMGAAIAQLKVSLDQVKTNEPINRREGRIDQANLERDNAKSFRAAIAELGK